MHPKIAAITYPNTRDSNADLFGEKQPVGAIARELDIRESLDDPHQFETFVIELFFQETKEGVTPPRKRLVASASKEDGTTLPDFIMEWRKADKATFEETGAGASIQVNSYMHPLLNGCRQELEHLAEELTKSIGIYDLAKANIEAVLPFPISELLKKQLQKLAAVAEKEALAQQASGELASASREETDASNFVYRTIEKDYASHLAAGEEPHVPSDRPGRDPVLDLYGKINKAIEAAIYERHDVGFTIGTRVIEMGPTR